MEKIEFKIRKYQEEDRESVRRICCDTGFWGKPIDPIYQDRECLAGMIVDPYLDTEPENAFVVEGKGGVVGYLTASMNPHFEIKILPKILKIAATMQWRNFKGTYDNHPRSRKFVSHVTTRGIFELPKHPKNSAHLHINLAEEYRNKNIGLELLKRFENLVISNGLNQYYGQLFSTEKKRTERLYERIGFEIFDKKRTRIFEPEISEPLYGLCITKKLNL